MKTKKLIELRDFLKALPNRKFMYHEWFDDVTYYAFEENKDRPPVERKCGTTACVAGWCCIHFKLHKNGWYDAGETAAAFLGLDTDQWDFLFRQSVIDAKKEDAIRRLDWLIARKKWEEYDFTKESWTAETKARKRSEAAKKAALTRKKNKESK